ncbi:MAG: hypothetical protein GWP08_15180 [Nitrospiraceae bacterium]|nr:hypothetical protein [Nitrospiraceae bacterium]
MISQFREVDRAIAYLLGALEECTSNTHAHVAFYDGKATPSAARAVGISQLTAALERFCRHFPEATVVLESDGKTGPLFALQCRCPRYIKRACPHHCKGIEDRPVVSVAVCLADRPPTEEEQRETLRAIFRDVEEFKQLEKKKRGKLGHRHSSWRPPGHAHHHR